MKQFLFFDFVLPLQLSMFALKKNTALLEKSLTSKTCLWLITRGSNRERHFHAR
jgi:hypothetical protein